LVDDEYGRYILGYNAGLDAQRPWQRPTYPAVASRPGGSSGVAAHPASRGEIFRLVSVAPNPGCGPMRTAFVLPGAGSRDVGIYR